MRRNATYHAIVYHALGVPVLLALALLSSAASAADWTPRERTLIDALSLAKLGPLPASPSNRFADDLAAARLGKQLFHDPRLSRNGEVSCASCHRADYDFSDALPTAKGVGAAHRRSMPLTGAAYQRWFFWDGRADSLWAQALEPLENPLEHGIDRSRVAQLIAAHYADTYEAALAPLPALAPALLSDPRPALGGEPAQAFWQSLSPGEQRAITSVFVNSGKAIAAFVRTLSPGQSRFDDFADALAAATPAASTLLSADEQAGLRLFLGRGRCINCHNGPMFSNGEFHHAAVPDRGEPDLGRVAVAGALADREFSCTSEWSDASPGQCDTLQRVKISPLESYRAFKTPSLRNVALRPPYMHAGQLATLEAVLRHYQENAGKGPADELFHGDLSAAEQRQLVAFLATLSATD